MKQDWDINEIKIDEVAQHLIDYHSFEFNDRRALSCDDFIFEHFPSLMKDMEDNGYGYLSEQGKEKIKKANELLKNTLKHCEERAIAIAKVYDLNEKGEGEWRICKPTKEQLEYLKFKRWFASAEGYFNKAVCQDKMLSTPDLDILMEELKDKILDKQKQREVLLVKRKKKKNKEQIEEQEVIIGGENE